MRSDIDAMAQVLPKANAAGMCLVLGDDYGAIFFPHGPYAEELAYYAEEIGIPSLDVIRWATKHGAELMGRAHELGTVEVGGQAGRPPGGGRRPARRRHHPAGPEQPVGHHQGRPDGQGRSGRDGSHLSGRYPGSERSLPGLSSRPACPVSHPPTPADHTPGAGLRVSGTSRVDRARLPRLTR